MILDLPAVIEIKLQLLLLKHAQFFNKLIYQSYAKMKHLTWYRIYSVFRRILNSHRRAYMIRILLKIYNTQRYQLQYISKNFTLMNY